MHWAHGGTHDPANLIVMCSGHHTLHHDGLLTVTGRAPDEVTFRRAGQPLVDPIVDPLVAPLVQPLVQPLVDPLIQPRLDPRSGVSVRRASRIRVRPTR